MDQVIHDGNVAILFPDEGQGQPRCLHHLLILHSKKEHEIFGNSASTGQANLKISEVSM